MGIIQDLKGMDKVPAKRVLQNNLITELENDNKQLHADIESANDNLIIYKKANDAELRIIHDKMAANQKIIDSLSSRIDAQSKCINTIHEDVVSIKNDIMAINDRINKLDYAFIFLGIILTVLNLVLAVCLL